MNYKDRYLHFTYNGIHSSDLGVFYINKGEDISLPFTPNVSRQTATPLHQNITYNLGSSEQSRSHSLQLAADQRNLNDVQDIVEWLNQGEFGKLVFDFRPDYVYKVYVNKIKPPVIIPHEFANNVVKHIVMLEVEFLTYGDHFVETREPYTISNIQGSGITNLYEPDELLPIYKKIDNKSYFINWSEVNQFINILNIGSNIEVIRRKRGITETIYKYKNLPLGDVITIRTDLGVVLRDGSLIEKTQPNSMEVNKGVMPIESGLIFSGIAELRVAGSSVRLNLDNRFKAFNNADILFVYVERKLEEGKILEPNKDEAFWFKGFYEHQGNQLILPEVKNGTYNSSLNRISFANEGLGLTSGTYKIKIAVGTELQFLNAGGSTEVSFYYKKGV